MHARVTRITASVGCSMAESATFSIRTSHLLCMIVALMAVRSVLVRCAVLLVRDRFHPVDDLSVFRFLNRDVRHCGVGHRAMPMLLARRAPHHVSGPDDPDRSAPALHEPAA